MDWREFMLTADFVEEVEEEPEKKVVGTHPYIFDMTGETRCYYDPERYCQDCGCCKRDMM